MEEEEEGGGYSQLQSESYGPATITSAVIMNTLVDHGQGASQPFRRGVPLARLGLFHHTSRSSILRRSLA